MSFLSNEQIGFALRAARRKAGMTGKGLAEACGLSPSAISRIESGKQALGFGEAVAVCDVLGLRLEHLVSLSRGALSLAREAADVKLRLLYDLQRLEKQCILGAVEASQRQRAKRRNVPPLTLNGTGRA